MDGPGRHVAVPQRPTGAGVLVLSGSSGRVEEARCDVLARQGLLAVSCGWFGGPGQPPGICEVPLEGISAELHALRRRCERVGMLGLSKSAEAGLLLASLDPGVVDALVAVAPSSLAWANVGPGVDGRLRPCRASWTWQGRPVPFVPYDDTVAPAGDPPEFRGVYETSRVTFAERVEPARIPVEQIAADLLLIAGGDDRMWPGVPMAEEILQRRAAHGRRTVLVESPEAGHRVLFPGEVPPPDTTAVARGGSAEHDAALGLRAWPRVLEVLGGRAPVTV